MKVLLGGKYGELFEELSETGASVTVVEERTGLFEALEGTFELVIVHAGIFGQMYPWEWIPLLRDKQSAASITVIPDGSLYDSLWLEVLYRLGDDFFIRVAPLGSNAKSLLAELSSNDRDPASAAVVGGSGRGIVAALWSAANKDGATTVAVNAAVMLARSSQLNVGLLDLNLKNPEIKYGLQLKDLHRSNLLLRPKLHTGTLAASDLLDACQQYRKTPRLHILAGSHRRDTAGDVTPGMVEHLLETCRAVFDVTIADVSAFPDNAATVCAVKNADMKWLVAQQDFASHRLSWTEWYECYWKYIGLHPQDISLVLNRYAGGGESPEKIAGILGMKLACSLPNATGWAGPRESLEGPLFIDLPGADSFADGIRQLASRLSVAAGAPALPERQTARRNGLLTLLSGLFT
ncbi:AAA family ATPase [Paenibacillus thermotolerans]|uniref:AAA family ATPase n=1 Tax=Paenibacillus thermotolerans TaxID=3027807 RepID=UPI0023685BDC|nr:MULTISPECIES: hypothetical protein [unclassified Paenibacillus]